MFRNEVLELIQYQPAGTEIYKRPLLIVPPQINKFYALDLSAGRSFADTRRATACRPSRSAGATPLPRSATGISRPTSLHAERRSGSSARVSGQPRRQY